LGYGGDGIPTNVFVGDQVTVILKNVTGPGDFYSYDYDAFGNPKVLFNTRDGISTNDFVSVHAGGDAHLNWAFTQAGTYTVTLEVSGTLLQGNKAVSSGPVSYTFVVQTVLTIEHTDLQAAYDPSNLLQLLVFDVNHTIAYKSNEVALVVAEAAKTTLPDSTPLGPGGSSLWIIPASQDPDLLYLGTSAEPPTFAGRPGIPTGAFNGNLTLRLISVDGPGQFIVWQTPGGTFDFAFDTRDGITGADAHTVILGSHEHFNWAFSTNGLYNIALQFSGQLADGSSISSPITPISFNVLPLPTNAPPAKIQLSQAKAEAGGGFAFNVDGAVNGIIDVQGSEDLKQWAPVLTNVAVTTSSQTISIPADPTKRQRSFRVLAH
jgi:surface-anchored protein